MNTVYIGLGANLGDRKKNISSAIENIQNLGIIVNKISSIIETEPQGGPPQGKFLNAVIKAKTDFSPYELLNHLKGIEKRLGRKKTVKNGPRVIDIDILLYENLNIISPQLTVPHPRMLERSFVLGPLDEIAPDIIKGLKNESN